MKLRPSVRHIKKKNNVMQLKGLLGTVSSLFLYIREDTEKNVVLSCTTFSIFLTFYYVLTTNSSTISYRHLV